MSEQPFEPYSSEFDRLRAQTAREAEDAARATPDVAPPQECDRCGEVRPENEIEATECDRCGERKHLCRDCRQKAPQRGESA